MRSLDHVSVQEGLLQKAGSVRSGAGASAGLQAQLQNGKLIHSEAAAFQPPGSFESPKYTPHFRKCRPGFRVPQGQHTQHKTHDSSEMEQL